MKTEALARQWKKLDIYINELRQGMVLVKKGTPEHIKFINEFREYLASRQKVIYLDFAKLTDVRDIAVELMAQYKHLFGEIPEHDLPDEDYRLLDFSLTLFSNPKSAGEAVMWLDNFTEILKMKEADHLFGMLRGTFQHQDNIVHVFTSDDKDALGHIFSTYENPFFRFGVQISL